MSDKTTKILTHEDFVGKIKGLTGKRKILGLPPTYTSLADYRRRVYDKSILADFPVISIVPGILKYRGSISMGVIKLTNFIAGDFLPIERDGRRVYFKYAYSEYVKYLTTMASSLLHKMMQNDEISWERTVLFLADFLSTTESELYDEEISTELNDEFGSSRDDIEKYVKAYEDKVTELVDKIKMDEVTVDQLLTIPKDSETESFDIADNKIGELEDLNKAAKYGKNSNRDRIKGLSFFADSSTTSSISIDNSYIESTLEQEARSAANKLTDMKYSVSNKNWFGKITTVIGGLMDGATSIMTLLGSDGGASAILKGAKLTFPKVFEGSSYNGGNYSISFKFTSPYGDPFSIFQYVYLPTLALLCFVLPQQLSATSYIAPFTVKVDYPGNFAVDLGAITRVSVDKNADSNNWTVDGLPLSLNVTVDVMDLYPTFMMAKSITLMNIGVSMSVYLNNMAGLVLESKHPWKRTIEERMNRFKNAVEYAPYKTTERLRLDSADLFDSVFRPNI